MPIDPITGAFIASAVANTGGAIFGGQDQPDPTAAGDVHLANAGQLELYNMMLKQIMSGSGDFGAGQGIKQGKSQLSQFMSDRGINPGGGAGLGAMSNMIGTASAGANQNRLGYAMNLMRSPLQTVQTAGSNWMPSSPSYGAGPTEQWKISALNQRVYDSRYGRVFGPHLPPKQQHTRDGGPLRKP